MLINFIFVAVFAIVTGFEQSFMCQSSHQWPSMSLDPQEGPEKCDIPWDNKAHPAMGRRFTSSMEKCGYIPSLALVFH